MSGRFAEARLRPHAGGLVDLDVYPGEDGPGNIILTVLDGDEVALVSLNPAEARRLAGQLLEAGLLAVGADLEELGVQPELVLVDQAEDARRLSAALERLASRRMVVVDELPVGTLLEAPVVVTRPGRP